MLFRSLSLDGKKLEMSNRLKCERSEADNLVRHRTARGGPEQGEMLWIATDRFDLKAETIATIYKRRWTVEIFFRFFKHVPGCRHLLKCN